MILTWEFFSLSLPFVATLDALGVSPARDGRTYDAVTEALLEKLLASLLMAATAALFFEIGMRAQLPVFWSVILAVGGAFGSQIWSSASRTLWSQSWEVLLASCAVLLGETDERGVRSCWLGTILAWMFLWSHRCSVDFGCDVVSVALLSSGGRQLRECAGSMDAGFRRLLVGGVRPGST